MLSDKLKNQFWIPEGFAHGFLTLSKSADVLYKTTKYWSKENERSLIWDDELINIKWPLKKIKNKSPKLSKKDLLGKCVSRVQSSLHMCAKTRKDYSLGNIFVFFKIVEISE